MSGKILIVDAKDVKPLEMESATAETAQAMVGGHAVIRNLIGRSNGSERIQFMHSFLEEGLDVEALREGADELAYIIQGEAEVEFEGQRSEGDPALLAQQVSGTLNGFDEAHTNLRP